MIKKLLTLVAIGSFATASAQVGGRMNSIMSIQPVSEISKSITYMATSSMPVGCDTITTAQNNSLQINTAGSDTSVPGCNPKAGYVFGTNCYGDKEKANWFPASTFSAIAQPSVTGVIVSFFKTGTKGTAGSASTTVGMSLYNGSLAGGPTTALGSTAVTMPTLLASYNPTSTIANYAFTFPAPVSVPATGFFASVVIPSVGVNGDTAIVFNSPASTVDYGFEKWNDNSWNGISATWGASLKANLSIYPILCGNLVITGVSKNLGLSKNINIMPNPSTGLVSVVAALPNSQDITLTVTNALGQVIINNSYGSVLTDVFHLDLTNQSNGVYFVSISNGQDKMVQRLILNK